MAVQYQQPRKRFTVDEYQRMSDAGILHEDDRVELIDGEIVQMSPINVPHAVCVDRLSKLLSKQTPDDVLVRVQSPIYLDEANEPEPDIAVLKPRDYLAQPNHPGAGDLFLLVEVSDTTLAYDRRIKMPLYARAGIAELWIVNVSKVIVEVYTDPTNGTYGRVQRKSRGHTITPQALPDIVLSVDDFLG